MTDFAQQGRDAWWEGDGESDCPYEPWTEAGQLWLSGWRDEDEAED